MSSSKYIQRGKSMGLKPGVNGGKIFTRNGQFVCKDESDPVVAIQFINKGTNSLAFVKFGACEIPLRIGEPEEIKMATGLFDGTVYDIRFQAVNPAQPVINFLTCAAQYQLE